jgi:hypothetical protein
MTMFDYTKREVAIIVVAFLIAGALTVWGTMFLIDKFVFCRQRAKFEDENDAFWIREAEEWGNLIFEYASPQFLNLIGQTARGRTAAVRPASLSRGGF